jgi:hypothetical protein
MLNIALIYLDRLLVRSDADFVLTQTNIKRLVFGCLTLATKFFNDSYEKRTVFSIVAETTRDQMWKITDFIIDTLDFDLNVRSEDYDLY